MPFAISFYAKCHLVYYSCLQLDFFKTLAFKVLNMWRQFCCSGDKDCEHLTKYMNFEHAYCLAVKHLGVHCAVLPVSLAMIILLYLSVKGAFGGVC